MRKLEYTFKTDTLFKMLFVQYPELLKKLVADLLTGQGYSTLQRTIVISIIDFILFDCEEYDSRW